jgi:uncharacterized protein YaeQ
VAVWQVDPEASQALAAMVERSMSWQVSIQDGTAWISDTSRSVEITPVLLKGREG